MDQISPCKAAKGLNIEKFTKYLEGNCKHEFNQYSFVKCFLKEALVREISSKLSVIFDFYGRDMVKYLISASDGPSTPLSCPSLLRPLIDGAVM